MAFVAIVDGDYCAREDYAAALGQRGHAVFSYASSEDALREFDHAPPDLLLLDSRLPEGSGYELAAQVRSLYSASTTRIIFVTKDTSEADYLRGYAAGADDFLTKPVSESELVAKATRALRSNQASREPVNPQPEPGALFAERYLVESRLGAGGYGAVFAVRDRRAGGAPKALKVLSGPFAEQPEARRRFLREIYTLSALDHPAVVACHESGEWKGTLYYTMERVEGLTLWDYVKQHGPLRGAELRDLLVALCGALEQVGALGLVHRDLKPGNVILRSGRVDQAVLVDFGLARRGNDRMLTAKDMVLGTLGYMAPENLDTGQLTPLSDLYSLAMVAYFASSGLEPLEGLSPAERLRALPIPVRFPRSLPWALRRLLVAMSSTDPHDRPPGPATVRKYLAWLSGLEPESLAESGWLVGEAASEIATTCRVA